MYKEYASKDYIIENRPDFLQNDTEQISYIKNRPFYSTYEVWPQVVFPERTIHFNPSDGAWSQINGGPLSFDNPISFTETYRVTIEDNIVLDCDFKIATINNVTYKYIGNGYLFHFTLDNSGEPFYIEINNSGQISNMIYNQKGGVYNYTKTFKIEYKNPINKPILLLTDSQTFTVEDENIGGPTSYACAGYKATEGDKLRLTVNDRPPIELELIKSPIDENYLYAGNLGLAKTYAPGYDLSEEYYTLLIPVNSSLFEIYFDQPGEYNYKLELLPTEIIHKLDNKYISDEIFKKLDKITDIDQIYNPESEYAQSGKALEPIFTNLENATIKTIAKANIGELSPGVYRFTDSLIDDDVYIRPVVGTGILIIGESVEQDVAEGRIIKPFIYTAAIPTIIPPSGQGPCIKTNATGCAERVFNGTKYIWKVHNDYEILSTENNTFYINEESTYNQYASAKVVYNYVNETIKELSDTVTQLSDKINKLEENQNTVIADYNKATDLIGGAE